MAKCDLRSQLKSVREAFHPFYGRGTDVFYPVLVKPTLSFCLAPCRQREREGGSGLRDEAARKRERMAWALAGGGPPPAGLVEGPRSESTPPAPRPPLGMGGLTRNGGDRIEQFCRVVRQDRGLYAMWTVTLPHEAAVALNGIERGFQRFVDRLRRSFSQALARACARERGRTPCLPHWCFVIEPQTSGRPHLHVVFRCRSRMGRPWLLSTGGLDRLIASALVHVTGEQFSMLAAGNVQALRKDPGRYLSGYLKKSKAENSACACLAAGWTINLIPRQWWGISTTARALVDDHTFPIPAALVGWLSKLWPWMNGSNVLRAKVWRPPGEGAPQVVVGSWPSVEAFVWCMEHLAQRMTGAIGSPLTYGYT